MLCDTCTNRMRCENEERQMCIANDFDRYDDDTYCEGDEEYDDDIDSVKDIFSAMMKRTAEKGSQTLFKTCLSINTLVDKTLADMLLMNCIHAIEHC